MLPCQTHQLPIIHQDVPIDALLVKVNLGFKKTHARRAYVEADAPISTRNPFPWQHSTHEGAGDISKPSKL